MSQQPAQPQSGSITQSRYFSLLILFLLTFQAAGTTILATYTQRNSRSCKLDTPKPPLESGFVCRYDPSHLLATAELMKVFASLLWCAFDVYYQVTAPKVEEEPASLLTASENDAGVITDEELLEAPTGDVEAMVTAVSSHTAPADANVKFAEESFNKGSGAVTSASYVQATELEKSSSSGMSKPLELVFAPLAKANVHTFAHLTLAEQLRSRTFWQVYLHTFRLELGLSRDKLKEACVMVVPAVMYAVQNVLFFVALQLIEPALFQLCYQIRILLLAFFMRVVLNLKLTPRQCIALVLLTVGIAFAQWNPAPPAASGKGADKASAGVTAASRGFIMVMSAAVISSASGVFLEVVYKKRGNHFHLSARNVHLAFFSVFVFLGKFAFEYVQLSRRMKRDAWVAMAGGAPSWMIARPYDVYMGTFFQGFTGLVWCLVLMQALAGILIALVMKYSNNIMKTFSTSLAILISTAASVALFDMTVKMNFAVGVVLVMASVFMYNVK